MTYKVNRFVRFLLLLILGRIVKKYCISAHIPENVQNLKPPYLFVGNHVGFWDPFIGGYFLPYHIHFVSSELVLTNPFFRFILKQVKTIPIKKNTRDSQSIRTLIQYIRNDRCVGLYPEGSRTWSGSTLPFDPSVVKLIRFLKVPVVACRLKGMHLSNPRWARSMRKCKIEVEYELLYTKDMVKSLRPQQIFEGLQKGLDHDEVRFQRERMYAIQSENRAEFISHALYLCPSCQGIDTFHCYDNEFHCKQCTYSLEIDKYGFLKKSGGGTLHFDNIRDWCEWEEKELMDLVKNKCHSNDQAAIFCDTSSTIFFGTEVRNVKAIGQANCFLFIDRIEIQFVSGKKVILDFDRLQAINAQHQERLEIYYENKIYRMIGSRSGVSALKWDVAVNAIWQYRGQNQKLSAYIKKYPDTEPYLSDPH